MRVFALSDLHVDFTENKKLLESLLGSQDHAKDVCLVGGDISHEVKRITETLKYIKSKFRYVFYVPGNHELWLTKEEEKKAMDSKDKFAAVIAAAESAGCLCNPKTISLGDKGNLTIVPLFSWYDNTLYIDKGREELAAETIITDFKKCCWNDKDSSKRQKVTDLVPVTSFFLKLNADNWKAFTEARGAESQDSSPAAGRDAKVPVGQGAGPEQNISKTDDFVITFSHFLPRKECILGYDKPWPRMRWNFSRIAGTARLDAQIRAFGSRMHLYGHSHRNVFKEIDGVRYASCQVGYPYERSAGHCRFSSEVLRPVWECSGPSVDSSSSEKGS